MTFTVTYRDKNGALRDEIVEATSRAECVDRCKRQGLMPKSIHEGKPRHTHPKGQYKNKYLLMAIAILCAAVLGSVWWWCFPCGKDKRASTTNALPKQQVTAKKESKKSSTPRADSPIPTAVNTNVAKSSVEVSKSSKDNGEYVDERGIRRTANGLRIRTGEPARKLKLGFDAHRRFKYMSEEHIAGLLEIIPGRMVFGRMTFGKQFVEDFKDSLDNKIEILDTDSEYDKQLKRDVIATKEELKAAMGRGEDIGKLLTDARNQLQEIGQYREQLKQRFNEYRKEGTHTVEELQDFVRAANVMLEEHGAKPIKLSSLLLRNLRLQQGEIK